VLPHDDLRSWELAIEVLHERVECAGHVPVAKVPRRGLGSIHLLVVLFGVADQTSVLLCEEEFVVGDPAITPQIGVGPPPQLDELGHDFVLARNRIRERESVAIGLPLASDLVEARIALTGPTRLAGIDPLEVLHDRLHRGTEAVEIQPVEAGLGCGVPVGVVAGPEPLHEAEDVTVSPHPRRKTAKVRQCRIRVLVIGQPHHVSIHTVGIGPISLDGDRRKAPLVDEATGDPGPLPVELVRAMRCLADQDKTPIAHNVEQRIVVLVLASNGTTVIDDRRGVQGRGHEPSVVCSHS